MHYSRDVGGMTYLGRHLVAGGHPSAAYNSLAHERLYSKCVFIIMTTIEYVNKL